MASTINENGRLRAVLLDWAGTAIDHGSRAPARVFVEVFAAVGIELTESEARGPMGLRELCSYKFIIEGTGQVRG